MQRQTKGIASGDAAFEFGLFMGVQLASVVGARFVCSG